MSYHGKLMKRDDNYIITYPFDSEPELMETLSAINSDE